MCTKKWITLTALFMLILVGCKQEKESGIQAVGERDTTPETTEQADSQTAGDLNLAELTEITPENAAQLGRVGMLSGNAGGIASLEFSPDGNWMATGGPDGVVIVWDMTTGMENSRWPANEDGVWAVGFNPDSALLATGGQDSLVHIWDIATQTETATFTHVGPVSGVAFSPDGTLVAASTFAFPTEIVIWNVETGAEVNRLSRRRIPHFAVEFAPDGKTLYSASGYGSVWIWDLATNQYVDSLADHGRPLYDMDLSSDGKWVVMGAESRAFTVNDALTGEEVFGQRNLSGPVNSVAFNQAVTLLATVAIEDFSVHVWDFNTDSEVMALTAGTNAINVVGFNPNGRLLVSGEASGDIWLWGVK